MMHTIKGTCTFSERLPNTFNPIEINGTKRQSLKCKVQRQVIPACDPGLRKCEQMLKLKSEVCGSYMQAWMPVQTEIKGTLPACTRRPPRTAATVTLMQRPTIRIIKVFFDPQACMPTHANAAVFLQMDSNKRSCSCCRNDELLAIFLYQNK